MKSVLLLFIRLIMFTAGCAKQSLHSFTHRLPAQENMIAHKFKKGDLVRLKDGTTQFIESISEDGKVNFKPSHDPFDHIKIPNNYPIYKLVLAVQEKDGLKVGQKFSTNWWLEPIGEIAFIFEDGKISFETENIETGSRKLTSSYIDEFKVNLKGELVYKQSSTFADCLRVLKNIL